jgi:hypothetical protein
VRLSQHFQARRTNKGLTLGQLAKSVGYRNISKGARRIATFEAGGEIRWDLLLNLARVLGIDQITLERLADADRQQALADWNRWADEPIQPYIVIRLLAAVYSTQTLPPGLSREQAEAEAAALARRYAKSVCLVWSRRISIWFDHEGNRTGITEAQPGKLNAPWMQVGNKKFLLGGGGPVRTVEPGPEV